ncbi:MAG: hypothetical protein HPY66_3374 [Firmicutes bacterium]|nr:hypothetical protein [Bacillota bacterium]
MDTIIKAAPFYYADTLKPGVYKGVDEPVQMPYFSVYWIANKNVDAGIMEEILKVTFKPENRKTLADGHPMWAEIQEDTETFEKLGPPVHPGVKSYFGK